MPQVGRQWCGNVLKDFVFHLKGYRLSPVAAVTLRQMPRLLQKTILSSVGYIGYTREKQPLDEVISSSNKERNVMATVVLIWTECSPYSILTAYSHIAQALVHNNGPDGLYKSHGPQTSHGTGQLPMSLDTCCLLIVKSIGQLQHLLGAPGSQRC